jgi:hypothetical protein
MEKTLKNQIVPLDRNRTSGIKTLFRRGICIRCERAHLNLLRFLTPAGLPMEAIALNGEMQRIMPQYAGRLCSGKMTGKPELPSDHIRNGLNIVHPETRSRHNDVQATLIQ